MSFCPPIFASNREFEEVAQRQLIPKSAAAPSFSAKGTKENPIRVLHASLESTKAQVGGLGSVVSALVPMQTQFGQKDDSLCHLEARLITPFYDIFAQEFKEGDCKKIGTIPLYYKAAITAVDIYKTKKFGFSQYLVTALPTFQALLPPLPVTLPALKKQRPSTSSTATPGIQPLQLY
jgi:hypothetical protein